MQSIKNTTIGIMLLFLSYGVYQVIMKPMPLRHGLATEDVDLLTISDPVELAEHSKPSGKFEKPEGANDLIPPELLKLTPPIAKQQPLEFGQPEMAEPQMAASNFGPPKSLSFDSSNTDDMDPSANRNDDFAQVNRNQPSSMANQLTTEGFNEGPTSFGPESTPSNPQQIAVQIDDNSFAAEHRQLDSDAKIMMASGMTDVVARPENANEPNSENPAVDEPMGSEQPRSTETLSQTWPQISQMVERSEFQPALLLLSKFYRAEDLSADDRQQVLDWLDALAAKVIYSSEHHLRSVPYIIQPGDTIASLARKWQVPAQLIYNVNVGKISDPNNLAAGVEIKLIQGPFDAEIDSQNQTMTLFLDGMYAGRFNIQATPAVTAGKFSIVDKSAGGQPERPWWISLSNGVSMFAASGSMATQDAAIALEPREAEEIFSILSASSTVRVLR